MTDVWANSMACHRRATCHIAGCCYLANSMSWSESYVSHCRVVLLPGEFNDMPSQSHVRRCRVGLLPLDEFTVMIPWPHATLQDVRIQSAILKIVFRHIFCFLNAVLGFDERRLSYRLCLICCVNWTCGFVSLSQHYNFIELVVCLGSGTFVKKKIAKKY